MSLARRIVRLLGPNAWLVRQARPVRELALDLTYGRAGLPTTVNGIQLRVLPRHRSYFASDYDAAVAAYFRDRIRAGAVCISVGANLGVYPLQFAHWSGPSGMVYAFEPNPQTATVFRQHIRLNSLEGRICVIEKAVSESPGRQTFYISGVDGMSRLGEPNSALAGHTTEVGVEVESLDNFCATENVHPEALMIDVEGFEAAALCGARSLFIDRKPPITVVEMHPNAWNVAQTDRASFEHLLAEYGLQAIPLSGQTDPLKDYGHVALEPVNR